MNINQIINTFGVKYYPKEFDEKIICDYYFERLKTCLPSLTLDEFKLYINEDYLGGWEECCDYNATGRRELKVLYCILRHIKPKNILEIGTYQGIGLEHILLACKKNQDDGHTAKVTTVDIQNFFNRDVTVMYPHNRIISDSLIHLSYNTDYDFIIQDGNHDPNHVRTEFSFFKNMKTLKTVWSHDYYLNQKQIGLVIESFPNDFFKCSSSFKEDAYIAGFHLGLF